MDSQQACFQSQGQVSGLKSGLAGEAQNQDRIPHMALTRFPEVGNSGLVPVGQGGLQPGSPSAAPVPPPQQDYYQGQGRVYLRGLWLLGSQARLAHMGINTAP